MDFNGIGTPGWTEQAVAELERDIKAGARGLKVYKQPGIDASLFPDS